MRKLSPAYVVTSLVVAIAGAGALTQAQAATKSAGTIVAGSAMRSGSTVTATSATGIPSTASTTTGTGTGTTTGTSSSRVTLSNTSPTDTRNAQTMDATAATHLSGPSPFTTGGATTTTAAGTGSSSGTSTTGGVINNGTDVTGTTGTSAPLTTLGNPLIFNGAVTSDLAADNVAAMQPDQSNAVAIGNDASLAADTARSSANLDRVIKSAERDRKKIGRNGQLLHSIAPRTNVDRSKEMPDDGPTPALKGLAAR